MRIALTTALMLLATLALADEPTQPETKTEATTEEKTESSATQPAAAETETTAKADSTEEEKPFKPPAGYKAKRIDGRQVWCTKTVVLGSKFAKEDCRSEAQLREIMRSRASMREDLGQRRSCSGAGCTAN